MARLGAFSPLLRDTAWFHDTLVPEGWYSPDLIGAGLTIHTHTATGGIVSGGAATSTLVRTHTASGGLTTGGSADATRIEAARTQLTPIALPGPHYGDFSDRGPGQFVYQGSGGLTIGGAAAWSRTWVRAASGGITTGGAAAASSAFVHVASGGWLLAGAASPVLRTQTHTASGGLLFAGAADASYVPQAPQDYLYFGDGGIEFIAALGADASLTRVHVASGGLTLAGAAATSYVPVGVQITQFTPLGIPGERYGDFGRAAGFTHVASGGFALSGSAGLARTFAHLATDGMVFGGAAIAFTTVPTGLRLRRMLVSVGR